MKNEASQRARTQVLMPSLPLGFCTSGKTVVLQTARRTNGWAVGRSWLDRQVDEQICVDGQVFGFLIM